MLRLFSLLLLTATLASTTLAQSKPDAILGEWLSPKKDSRLLIYQQAGKYFGKITWGTGGPAKDEKNPNPALRNRDLIGLVILNDFQHDGEQTWEGGTIYDPRDGKTYSCKMTLKDASNLSIRGYVGVSLFGRSEVWTKVKGASNQ
ncbi:Protein of unknown function DUF2147 [Fibrisoma limi BUZ 3]|uniref:DUF2147 domain-containing protein n=1 Tax=Fibrisoma limi BUZ 3 TaxID=1185876 RepID=I2GGB6_9BACT|nr:DUF2147 domain-containing protein [Fibrisoma limi]CCH52941.1 Protein of unknown function DUF2147 [Fibrisoma limi BUZ 3]